MKCIVFLLYLINSHNNLSSDSTKTKTIGLVIKADVFFPMLSIFSKTTRGYSLTLEKPFKNRFSFQVTGLYFYEKNKSTLTNYDLTNTHTYSVQELIPEYKYWVVLQKEYSGPYVGLFIKYSETKEIKDDWFGNSAAWNGGVTGFTHSYTENYWYSYSIGTITGYQFYIKNKLVLDCLFGFGGRNIFKNKDLISNTYTHYGLGWVGDYRFALNVGYKF